MKKTSKIYITGHTGLLGSALLENLGKKGYENILTRTHEELDLRDQARVTRFFEEEKCEYVILCAAKVGGIGANIKYPAEFIHDNIAINTNVIHASYISNAKRLLFFGSSCCYPKSADQPLKEEDLFTGELEETSRPYAMAKLAGIQMCLSYNKQYKTNSIVLIPATLYGENDNFNPEEGHVLSALLEKFLKAKESGIKEVVLWGTGTPRREFIYVNDAAEAASAFLNMDDKGIDWDFPVINIGTERDIAIKELAELISEEVGYKGKVIWDSSRPDGAARRKLYLEKMKAYCSHSTTTLREGIRKLLTLYTPTQPTPPCL